MSRLGRFAAVLVALVAAAALLAGAGTPAASATANATTFSGRATVLQGSIAGIAIPCLASVNNATLLPQPPSAQCQGVGDTGDVAATGGNLETSLLCYPASNDPKCVLSVPDLTQGAARAKLLHATVVAHGNRSSAEASVISFGVNAAGQTVTADVLRAEASASCNNGSVSVKANAVVANLVISGVNNGQPITVKGDVNETINLPGGGQVILNGQTPVNGANGDKGVTVNALEIKIPETTVLGVTVPATDVIVGQATADIACAPLLPECPGKHQFVTGGGWIGPDQHFTVAGRDTSDGVTPPWGHVMWKPTGLHVKNPFGKIIRSLVDLDNVLSAHPELTFKRDPVTDASFQGGALLYWTADGSATGQIVGEALALDDGEPGRSDFFEIVGLNAGKLVSIGAGFLQGGNIQMHGKC
jgi:hypothetical protein